MTYRVYALEYRHAQNTVKHIYYICASTAVHLLRAEWVSSGEEEVEALMSW